MPTYEYKCRNCSAEFETIQRMSDDPLVQCDQCGTNGLYRVITTGNFILKGSGWYATRPDKRVADVTSKQRERDSKRSIDEWRQDKNK